MVLTAPQRQYEKGSQERRDLEDALAAFKREAPLRVPLVIGGRQIHNDSGLAEQRNPSRHAEVVARYSNATPEQVHAAVESALAAKEGWETLPFADRAAIFLKAADLISDRYRYELMAATMLGQGKNAWQAEIDAAAELCDFLRYGHRRARQGHDDGH